MEIYTQSNFKEIISFVNRKFSIHTNGFSGFCYTKATTSYREAGKFILSKHSKLNVLFSLELPLLRNYFCNVYDELSYQNIDLQIYFETISDLININGIDDTRFSSVIKVVFIDKYKDSYMDEIVVQSFQADKIINEIQIIINKNKFIIGNKKQRLCQQHWNGIPIILGSKAAGYFIHEIVGHMLEEDVFIYTSDLYNQIEISNKLSVYDQVNGFEDLTALNQVDDVGSKIKTITLIKNGALKNIFAVSREKSFDGELYGVARRESYLKDVMPRMRGTFVSNFEDLSEKQIIKLYKECIYIDHIYFGTCLFSTGEFLIQGDGYYFKNNEIQNIITVLKMQGNIKKHLEGIDHIGNDFKSYVCECGKMGNIVRVGIGSPTISISESYIEGVIYKNG